MPRKVLHTDYNKTVIWLHCPTCHKDLFFHPDWEGHPGHICYFCNYRPLDLAIDGHYCLSCESQPASQEEKWRRRAAVRLVVPDKGKRLVTEPIGDLIRAYCKEGHENLYPKEMRGQRFPCRECEDVVWLIWPEPSVQVTDQRTGSVVVRATCQAGHENTFPLSSWHSNWNCNVCGISFYVSETGCMGEEEIRRNYEEWQQAQQQHQREWERLHPKPEGNFRLKDYYGEQQQRVIRDIIYEKFGEYTDLYQRFIWGVVTPTDWQMIQDALREHKQELREHKQEQLEARRERLHNLQHTERELEQELRERERQQAENRQMQDLAKCGWCGMLVPQGGLFCPYCRLNTAGRPADRGGFNSDS